MSKNEPVAQYVQVVTVLHSLPNIQCLNRSLTTTTNCTHWEIEVKVNQGYWPKVTHHIHLIEISPAFHGLFIIVQWEHKHFSELISHIYFVILFLKNVAKASQCVQSIYQSIRNAIGSFIKQLQWYSRGKYNNFLVSVQITDWTRLWQYSQYFMSP